MYSYPLLSDPEYLGYTFFTSGLDFPIDALPIYESFTYTFTSSIPEPFIAHPLTFMFPSVELLSTGSSTHMYGASFDASILTIFSCIVPSFPIACTFIFFEPVPIVVDEIVYSYPLLSELM
ncbi:hypothetical protein D3C76_1573960 [compost metagenome]